MKNVTSRSAEQNRFECLHQAASGGLYTLTLGKSISTKAGTFINLPHCGKVVSTRQVGGGPFRQTVQSGAYPHLKGGLYDTTNFLLRPQPHNTQKHYHQRDGSLAIVRSSHRAGCQSYAGTTLTLSVRASVCGVCRASIFSRA